MNKKKQVFKWLLRSVILMLIINNASLGEVPVGTSLPDLSQLINKKEMFKIIFPKEGYLGTPFESSAGPAFRKPTDSKHFVTHFLSIDVLELREFSSNKRVVFRVDEVDEKFNIKRKGLYFAYVDMLNEGAKITCRYTDDNIDVTEIGIRYGIPFPFTCASVSAVFLKENERNGCRDRMGNGIKYQKKNSNNNLGTKEITAIRFKNLNGLEKFCDRKQKWYKSEIDDVLKCKKTKILFTEKQKWAKDADLLWNEMERFDKDGNILMRCKRIAQPAKEIKEVQVEE